MNPTQDTVSTLFEELKMAAFWHRPSILIAVYRSKINLLEARHWLEKKLRRNKQSVVFYKVTPENFDIPLTLSKMPNRNNQVVFITGLGNGGGQNNLNAYRALNFRRELLVEHSIRAVFWLDESEATLLPTQALDFWAFRHRLVEFFSNPTSSRINKLIEDLDWPYWDAIKLNNEFQEGIAYRSELLQAIPALKQSQALRAKLLHILAGMHWAANEHEISLTLLQECLAICKKESLPLEARCWIGLGIVYGDSKQYTRALEAFQQALAIDPTSAEAWGRLAQIQRIAGQLNNALTSVTKSVTLNQPIPANWVCQGDIYNDLGMRKEAILAYNQALAIDKKDPLIWIKLGDTYRLLDRPGDSILTFKAAQQLNPTDAETWLKLGLAYRDVGLIKKSIRSLYKAARINPLAALPWKKLAEIYRANNHLAYARKAYKTAAKLDPLDKTLLYSLDMCYIRRPKLI